MPLQDPSSLPRALLVDRVKVSGNSFWRPGGKVATVFEDPSIQASDTKLQRRFTHVLNIRGTGFNKVVEPILEFDPPLDAAAVNVHVSSTGALGKIVLLLSCWIKYCEIRTTELRCCNS